MNLELEQLDVKTAFLQGDLNGATRRMLKGRRTWSES